MELLTDTTTLCQSRPGSNGNKGLLHTHQRSRTETLPSDGFELYPGLIGVAVGSCPFADMQQGLTYHKTNQPISHHNKNLSNNVPNPLSLST